MATIFPIFHSTEVFLSDATIGMGGAGGGNPRKTGGSQAYQMSKVLPVDSSFDGNDMKWYKLMSVSRW